MSQFAQAASRGDVSEVQRMISAKADINEATLRGTALHEACRRGHLEIVQILCAAGARIDSTDITGDTPLHCCVSHGHVAIAALLISLRADVRAREVAGATPLQCAATSVFVRSDGARRELIERLLAAGADPHARDLVGVSPSQSGHVQVPPSEDIAGRAIARRFACICAILYIRPILCNPTARTAGSPSAL